MAQEPYALRRLLAAVAFAATTALAGCGGGKDGGVSYPDLQSQVIAEAHLDWLRDEVYQFPANRTPESDTVYLPLRKWDLIFTGPLNYDPDAPWGYLTSLAIPGEFNHMLVYLGKDEEGFAYAAEMQLDELSLIDNQVISDGNLRLLCLGTDFGQALHSSGAHVIDRQHYLSRWAKRLTESARAQLLEHDALLLSTLQTHIRAAFPYQLEFSFSYYDLYFSREIVLVDDGLDNGAGCTDYWTSLFEQYAGLCLTGVRMTASEVTDYFLYDPEGQQAFLPAEFNPLADTALYIKDDLLEGLGFVVIDDAPHRFVCDNSEEVGLVVPDLLFGNTQLAEIPDGYAVATIDRSTASR